MFCKIKKEGDTFVIENKMLDLYAAGNSINEAEQDLYSEFDVSFELLNSLPDAGLSTRLLRAKNMMNTFVKEITPN